MEAVSPTPAVTSSLLNYDPPSLVPAARPSYPYPYLCAELSLMVLDQFSLDHSMTIFEFVCARSSLLAAGRALNLYVRCVPALWSRILISPRIPLSFVLNCLDWSDFEPLYVSFVATHHTTAQPVTHLGAACSHAEYITHAAEALSLEFDRCAGLAIEADSPDILEAVLDEFQWTTPDILNGLLVRIGVSDYTDFRPPCLRRFRLLSIPPFGAPFPLFTSLTWLAAADIDIPTISFATTRTATSQIVHPSSRPVLWDDVLTVLVYSYRLTTLVLDGHLPLLTKLRIVSAIIQWGNPAYFAHVEHLEIQDVPRIAWPSVDQFVSALTTPAALEELILWGGGVVIERGVTLQPFTVNGLAVLSIFYTPATKSFLTALAPGSYPDLVELLCCDFDRIAWREMFRLSVFQNLTSLTICGATESAHHLVTLFGRLHSLEILDISDAGPQYFSAMYQSPLLCPRLRRLVVGSEDIARLAGYVIMRSIDSSYKLDALEYWHNFVYPLNYFCSTLVSDMSSRLVDFTGYPPFP
ncbi:hypothetical protein C8F04DRAFT_1275145 [Mycena alexandri]|uniref:Uncharacterized protein n=1 Tax=Mycena alexandri TaxID=1745969 RepID=A0AAD6S3V1_9AGAR|nr:hypothetical protein C8F04DRAFT_1275145 [Mycena alexandri]